MLLLQRQRQEHRERITERYLLLFSLLWLFHCFLFLSQNSTKPYKKSRKEKQKREMYSTFYPPDYASLKEIHICSLLFSLFLSLSLYVLSVSKLYIFVSVSILQSHQVLKKRDLLYHTYISEWEERFGLDRPPEKKEFFGGVWKKREN